jgi:hypothetical protein
MRTTLKKLQRHSLFILSFLILSSSFIEASDLVRVLPVTNKIIMVQFDEGHIDYFGLHQDRYNGNVLYYSLLDIAAAEDKNNYTIKSTNDGNYSSGKKPVNLGRKSKGVEFNNIYEAGEPKFLSEHLIYLELPNAMASGKTYTLSLNNLASNTNGITFTFDAKNIRSNPPF